MSTHQNRLAYVILMSTHKGRYIPFYHASRNFSNWAPYVILASWHVSCVGKPAFGVSDQFRHKPGFRATLNAADMASLVNTFTERGSSVGSVSASYASGPEIDFYIQHIFHGKFFTLQLLQEEQVVS